jgi:hypothetical protein
MGHHCVNRATSKGVLGIVVTLWFSLQCKILGKVTEMNQNPLDKIDVSQRN